MYVCMYVEGREKDAERSSLCLSAGDLLPCCVLT